MASRLDFSQIRSLYVGTSSNVTVGTDNLVVAGGAAIGTTSAFTFGGTAKLSVYADAPITFALSNTDAVYFRRYGVGQYQFQTTSNGGNTGDLSLQTYGGNVGVGTATPSYKLDVAGTIAINSGQSFVYASYDNVAALFQRVGTYGAVIQIGRSGVSSSTTIDYPADGTFAVTTAGSERMRITSGGNVGIGTTSPGAKLDIAQTGGTQLRIVSADAYGSADVQIELVSANDYRGRGIFYKNSTDSNQWFSGVPYTGGSYSIGYHTSQPEYLANSKFFINTSGNVGIGTTSPSTKLHVLNAGGVAVIGDGNDNYFGNYSSGDYWDIGNLGATGNVYLESRGASTNINGHYRLKGAGSHIWSYNGGSNEVMRTTSAGNVGIGTTSPSTLLHVAKSQTSDTAIMVSNLGTAGANTTMSFVLAESTTPQGWFRRYRDGSANTEIGFSDALLFTGSITGTKTERMRITADGNVGIGTTSPGSPLTVAGAGGSTKGTNGYLVHIGGTDGNVDPVRYMIGFSHGNTYTAANVRAAIGSMVTTGGAGNLVFETGTGGAGQVERMRINGDGNVGIGTTSPARKLDIVSSNAQIRISDGTANTYWEIMSLFFQSNQDFIIQNQNNVGILINSSGNVGVGTSTPGAKIHVVGSESRFGGVASGYISVYNATGRSGYIQANGGTDLRIASDSDPMTMYVNGSERMRISSAGALKLNAYGSGSNTGTATQRLAVDASGNVIEIPIGSGPVDGNGTANYVTKWSDTDTITNSIIYDNGTNVGIGTTSPGTILEVSSATPIFRISSSLNSSFHGIEFRNGGSLDAEIKQLPQTGEFRISNGRTSVWGGFITLYTDTIERMRITSAGNVGIGTTNPNNTLEVAGSLGSGKSTIRITNTDTGNYATIIAGLPGTSNAGMSFATDGTSKMVIDASGEVGIGTVLPMGPLEVYKANTGGLGGHIILNNNGMAVGNETAVLFNDSGVGSVSSVRAAISSSVEGSPYYGDLKFKTGATSYGSLNTRMIITGAGNVGIGTTAPGAPLHVYKSDTYSAIVSRADWNSSVPTKLALGKQYGVLAFISTDLVETTTDTSYIALNYKSGLTTFAEGLRVYNNGNVGIGTTSPIGRLTVSGDGGLNTYAGVLRVVNTATTNAWGYITLPDDATTQSAANNYYLIGRTANINNRIMSFHIPVASDYGSGAQPKFGFYSTGGDLLHSVEASTGTSYFKGNVGIGTTSPTQLLSVAGNTDLGNSIGSATSSTYTTRLSGYALYYDASNRYGNYGVLLLNADSGWTASSRRFMITNGYNANRFAIIRSVDSTTDPALGYGGSVTSGTVDFEINNAGAATFGSSVTTVGAIQSGGDIIIQNTYPRIQLIDTDHNSDFAIINNNGNFSIYDDTNSSHRLWIDPTGNVGIGTTSPGNKLDVQGNAGLITINTNGALYAGGQFISGAGEFASSSSGTDINFRAGATHLMVLKTSGNVGIGTTSPTAKLRVQSSGSSFTTPDNNDVAALSIYNSNNSSTNAHAVISLRTQISGGNPFISFDVENETGYSVGMDNSSNQFRIAWAWNSLTAYPAISITPATSPNVLIGTTTDSGYKLRVNGNSYFDGLAHFGQTATSGSAFRWGSYGTAVSSDTMLCMNQLWNGSGWTILNSGMGTTYLNLGDSSAAPSIQFGTGPANTAATTKMVITNAGNVGIGTTSPSEKLHVDGNVIVTYNNSFQGINSIGNKAILARVSPTTGIINYAEYATAANLNGFVLGSDDARIKGDIATDSLDFITNTSSRMFINSSGNVGIATTSPSYKLDVVGDSRITSGSLGVGVAPNATDGRIDASNDIVAYSTSDQRLKENVTPIENALEKVKTLTGVEFDWKEETAHVHGYHGHDVGIIAQDVQAVLPEAVRTNESGYLSVRYEKMIALLIEANKELAARVEILEQKLKQ